jgi:hypothetical protein
METDHPEPYAQLVASQLLSYCDSQSLSSQHARRRSQPETPWPAADNPMLRYLIANAIWSVETDGVPSALLWLATHAWFEGGLEAINRSAPSHPGDRKEQA